MHDIPLETLRAAGIPAPDANRIQDDWLRLYAGVREYLYPLLYRHQREWTEELFTPLLSGVLRLEGPHALIHGDWAVYHLLHHPRSQRLSAVIDFGTAGLGHLATDLAALLHQYGEILTRQAAYPDLEHLLPYARFWAATLELQWALAGVKPGDKGSAVTHLGAAKEGIRRLCPLAFGKCID